MHLGHELVASFVAVESRYAKFRCQQLSRHTVFECMSGPVFSENCGLCRTQPNKTLYMIDVAQEDHPRVSVQLGLGYTLCFPMHGCAAVRQQASTMSQLLLEISSKNSKSQQETMLKQCSISTYNSALHSADKRCKSCVSFASVKTTQVDLLRS